MVESRKQAVRMNPARSSIHLCLALGLLGLVAGAGATDPLMGGFGGLLGGVSSAVSDITGAGLKAGAGGHAGLIGGLGGAIPSVLNSANNLVSGVTRPAMSMLGSLAGGSPVNMIGDGMRAASGVLGGLTTGVTASLNPSPTMNGLFSPGSMHGTFKREAALAGEALGGVGAATAAAALGRPSQAAAAATAGALAAASPVASPATALELGAPVAAASGAMRAGAAAAATAASFAGQQQVNNQLIGADMLARGASGALGASLASSPYGLASVRDRVNFDAARFGGAAMAAQQVANRAEDSLIGSELAVGSASDALSTADAYATANPANSLSYNRFAARNIVPRPVGWPNALLPDVWLNGPPADCIKGPLGMLPYSAGAGQFIGGRPLLFANQGILLNGLIIDTAPSYMPLANGFGPGIAMAGSPVGPAIANRFLEDGAAGSNIIAAQQLTNAGLAANYPSYGRLNPASMVAGSVSEASLLPATGLGNRYPIGSELAMEQRDSF